MPETLGSAVLELTTDNTKFSGGVSAAEKSARRLDRSLETTSKSSRGLGSHLSALGGRVTSLARGLIGLRGALLVAAGAAGMLMLTRRSVETADSIGKTSRRLGLSAETLQEFRFAAERAGVELSEFNQALTALVRRQGSAVAGNKGFQDAFAQLGISVQELRRLNPEELFLRVADALSQMERQADRVAAADAVMSEAGRRVVNVFDGGAASIEGFRQEARDLGVILSSELIANAEQAADELSDMDKILKTASLNLGLRFVPALRELVNLIKDPAFIEGVETFAGLLEDLFRSMRSDTPEALRRQLEDINSLMEGFVNGQWEEDYGYLGRDVFERRYAELLEQRAVVEQQLKEAEEAERRAREAMAGKGEGGGNVIDLGASSELSKAMADLGFELDLLTGRYDFLAEGAAEAMRALGESGREALKTADSLEDLSPELQDFNEKMAEINRARAAARVIEETRTEAEKYAETIEELNTLLREGAIDQETHRRAVEKAREALEETKESTQAMDDMVRRLGFTFESAFEDAIIEGRSMREVLAGIIEDVARLILRLTVIEPLMESIGDALKGSSGGGSGGSGGGGFFSGIGDLIFGSRSGFGGGIGDFFSSFLPFAEGGRPPLSVPSIVGERGAELFVPDQSGTIIPNHLLGAASGPRGGDVFIDARGADQAAVDRLQRIVEQELAPGRIERRAVAGVVEERRRNPMLFGGR